MYKKIIKILIHSSICRALYKLYTSGPRVPTFGGRQIFFYNITKSIFHLMKLNVTHFLSKKVVFI